MGTIVTSISVVLAVLLAGAVGWRLLDHRADRAEIDRLRAFQNAAPARFASDMVARLPEPARRYFAFAIAEGTPLHTVGVFEMTGQFSLGTKAAPNYLGMTAQQVLAAPQGFVWKMSGGSGAMRVGGSDTGHWTRFWLAGIVPVARTGGDTDHRRSAFGRYAAEAAIWTPAAVLPGPDVTWHEAGPDIASYTMRRDGMEQRVDITVDAAGRPLHVLFQRWTNANPDRTYRLQPFGAVLSDFRSVQGFHIPFHVEAGNGFGTGDWFPFFIADLTDARFGSDPAIP
jgi:hypothetical protein